MREGIGNCWKMEKIILINSQTQIKKSIIMDIYFILLFIHKKGETICVRCNIFCVWLFKGNLLKENLLPMPLAVSILYISYTYYWMCLYTLHALISRLDRFTIIQLSRFLYFISFASNLRLILIIYYYIHLASAQ